MFTYAELDRCANRLSILLHGRGVREGDLVALRTERGPGTIVGMLAVLKIGAAYLPMDPEDPDRRAVFMLRDSGARCLLTDPGQGDRLPDFESIEIDLEALARPAPAGDETAAPPPRTVAATDTAYVIYTSGSTGEPKGTRIPHRGITSLVLGTDYVQLRGSDRVAHASNPSFDAATFEIWGALLNGACVVCVARDVALSPAALAQTLRKEGVTTLFVTTALFNQLVRHEPGIFSTLRYLLFGGEAASPHAVRTVLQEGPPQHLLHVYGPTECTTFSTWHEVTHVADDAATVPIGRPIAHSTCFVLDPSGQPAPLEAPGELYLGGDGLASGYHGQPELTAERFVSHPFDGDGDRLYRTGDLVRRAPDGALEFVGRLDQQVKLRGFRVELGEIEAALLRQAAVKAAAVVCREDEPGDKQLVAYVVTSSETGSESDVLRAALAAELPDFMIPATVQWMPALPVTKNGKVDRRALPAPQRRVARASVSPRSETERRVAAIWRDVLGLEELDSRDSFFDLGGHSLKLLAVHSRLARELGSRLSITDLFEHTTVEGIARALDGERTERSLRREADEREGDLASKGEGAIAIVAIAGRFPGADDVETFWQNLCDGVESVRFFTDEELRASGIPEELLGDPRYVRARAVLDGTDLFDARFFGYSALEAQLTDPQQRLFLECCYEALERAAIDPDREAGRVGVFAGASMNSYLDALRTRPELLARVGGMGALISSIQDFLTTRVSYQLNLRGPSLNVQTACSTSLVAVHEACRSLIERRCDTALAGGVSVTVPAVSGYLYEESGVRSSDGHCRAFDAAADGMVSGNGVGVVVLKRLEDAVSEGDEIHAVIRGSAVNNDGARKVGFTAPSIEGQAEVIAAAQSAAGIEPRSIGYVECHGTGTALGDPIEVAALARVFREGTGERGFCALASLKSNMGHLDAAAGVAGLIKAALAVRHGRIPPSLHFERANPEIDFPATPFFVNTACRDWTPADDAPRRAGVSAFGIGGTNVHAVLEEPPVRGPSGPSREWQVLQLSAKTPQALERMTERLAQHLRDHPEQRLADVAHSLRAGRRELDHRRAVLCRDRIEAVEALEGRRPERRWTRHARPGRSVVFLFPGQGAQHVAMGRGLYGEEPAFREVVDECLAHLPREIALELESTLIEAGEPSEAAEERLTRTALAQPALFVVEYALARLWISWGVTPAATFGHSVGEYVSACLADVLTLEAALQLVSARGRLMDSMPKGAMLAVPLCDSEVIHRLSGRQGLWLAAVNGPNQCVVSGASDAVETFQRELEAEGHGGTRLRTSHAFHSGLMDGAVAPFRDEVRATERNAPGGIPYVSGLTGGWVDGSEVADEGFWCRQFREPVQGSAGLALLLQDPDAVLLEVGPGRTLGNLARAREDVGPGRTVLDSLPPAGAPQSDTAHLMSTLGRLWTAGVALDAEGVCGRERRHRVALPTYPFERERYWIERRGAPAAGAARKPLDEWFHAPVWRSTRAPAEPSPAEGTWQRVLVFAGDGPGARVAEELAGQGTHTVVVHPGPGWSARKGAYTIAPDSAGDHARLIDALRAEGTMPERIVHAWSADLAKSSPSEDLERGFLSLAHLVRALSRAEASTRARLAVVTAGAHTVTGDEEIRPERCAASGVVRVASLEQPDLLCRLIDLECGDASQGTIDALVRELRSRAGDPVVALRGGRRWVETFAPLPLPIEDASASPLRRHGVYLITGGLGGMGLALARELAGSLEARLVLVGRSPLPDRSEWEAVMAAEPEGDVGRRVRSIVELEARGAEVLVAPADVSDPAAMGAAVDAALRRFGALHGVVHAAGVPPSGLLMNAESSTLRAVLAPKVDGTRVLMEAVAPHAPDFVVLCSSLNAYKGFPGAADYSAANAFLDAYARSLPQEGDGTRVVSIAWNRWRESGMAVRATGAALAAELGISDAEGTRVFRRVLAGDAPPNVLVSEIALGEAMRNPGALPAEAPVASRAPGPDASPTSPEHERPELSTEFVAPSTDTERGVAAIWQELFGSAALGAHDDFFELGGHSLLATQLLGRLLRHFPGAGLTLRTLFDHPTIAGQAARIELGEATGSPAPDASPMEPMSQATETPSIDSLSDEEVARLLDRLTREGP